MTYRDLGEPTRRDRVLEPQEYQQENQDSASNDYEVSVRLLVVRLVDPLLKRYIRHYRLH